MAPDKLIRPTAALSMLPEGLNKSIPNNLQVLLLSGFFHFSMLLHSLNEGFSFRQLDKCGHEGSVAFVSPFAPSNSFRETSVIENNELFTGDWRSFNQQSANLVLYRFWLFMKLESLLSFGLCGKRTCVSEVWTSGTPTSCDCVFPVHQNPEEASVLPKNEWGDKKSFVFTSFKENKKRTRGFILHTKA